MGTLTANEYVLLVEQAPILVWRSDTSGACDYFNERWLAFTGRTLEQELGDGWAEGVHTDDLERCVEIYRQHFGRRLGFEMEYRLRRADGAYRWIFDRGVPFEVDGEFAGFIGSCVDVHDRVEAQRELDRQRLERIEQLQNLLPQCMYCKQVHDEDGEWKDVAVYLRERASTNVSHGVCPTCKPRMMAAFQGELTSDEPRHRP